MPLAAAASCTPVFKPETCVTPGGGGGGALFPDSVSSVWMLEIIENHSSDCFWQRGRVLPLPDQQAAFRWSSKGLCGVAWRGCN